MIKKLNSKNPESLIEKINEIIDVINRMKEDNPRLGPLPNPYDIIGTRRYLDKKKRD